MTIPSAAIDRLELYSTSLSDVAYTFVGPSHYGYINTLPQALEDIAVVGRFLSGLVDSAVMGARWLAYPTFVRVRSTANVTIASGLENGDTLNGVTLVTGDHVFLPYQTDESENGIYTVPASGAASRATFADTAEELAMLAFLIHEGTAGGGERWLLSMEEANITVGTTDLEFSQIGIEPSYSDEVQDARFGESSLSDGIEKAISDATREKLTSNRTYYVRTDGSDSNDGLTDNSGGAFLTISAAVSAAYSVDSNKKVITIQVGDGTYAGVVPISGPLPGAGTLTIQGNSGTPANVIVSVTSASAFSTNLGAVVTIKDMEIRTTTSGNCLDARTNSIIQFQNVRFGSCAGAHLIAFNAFIQATGNYSIVGSAAYHIVAQTKSYIVITGRTVTLTGTPAFSGQFLFMTTQAVVEALTVTFSGSATGQRHSVTNQSIAYTGGGGESYFPGDVAGIVSSATFSLFV